MAGAVVVGNELGLGVADDDEHVVAGVVVVGVLEDASGDAGDDR